MALPSLQTRGPDADLGRRAEQTRTLLLDTARSIFLERGYGGTRVEDIADVAGTSRGTFYTYFESKRDVFLATGTESVHEAEKVIAQLKDIPTEWVVDDLAAWVSAWLSFLDVHGAFVLVWGQASYEDKEMRLSGVRAQIRSAKKLAATLVRLGHPDPVHATSDALALLGMIERLWYYHYVADGILDPDDLRDSILRIMTSLIGGAAKLPTPTDATPRAASATGRRSRAAKQGA